MTQEAEEGSNGPLQLNLRRELFTNTSCHFVGIFSPKSKHLLALPAEQRSGSAAAFSDLLAEMESIEFFNMFSNRTKEALAKTLKFVAQGADEFLLVRGETDSPQQALYLILSGVVTECHKPDSGDLWPEKILRRGEYFGHVDIVRGRPPTVDAQTVGYCELLMLTKTDFEVVRKEMEGQCDSIVHYLRTTDAVRRFGWSDEEYRVLEIYSKLRTYPENQDVYSCTDGRSSKSFWSYFVVSGECKVVKELSYRGADSDRMKAAARSQKKDDGVLTERFVFEEAKQGYYFGVGERFCGVHVVAGSSLECLLIPRLLLVFKDRELLRVMAKDLTDGLPTDQEVLDCHSKLVAASKKNMAMFRDMFKDKPERLIES